MNFKIWTSVILGTCNSVDGYRRILGFSKKRNIRIDQWANELLRWVRTSRKRIKIDLVLISVKDLGFKKAVNLGRVYSKAKEFGLLWCHPEVSLALLKQRCDLLPYDDKVILIAMKPRRASSHGTLAGILEFCHMHIKNYVGAIVLSGKDVEVKSGATLCSLDDHFIFVRSRAGLP